MKQIIGKNVAETQTDLGGIARQIEVGVQVNEEDILTYYNVKVKNFLRKPNKSSSVPPLKFFEENEDKKN